MGINEQNAINDILLEMKTNEEKHLNKIKGSLFGGAIGDALGNPVEFMSERTIRDAYGEDGITELLVDAHTGKAVITDDTQMTLFTADGILCGETRAALRGIGGEPSYYVGLAYRAWLDTQMYSFSGYNQETKAYSVQSWLLDVPELFVKRAPGNTCLTALAREELGSVEMPINDSKGCGGVMRVAPLALRYDVSNSSIENLDMEGAEIAALTHGHSLGFMPAAVMTHIINRIVYPANEGMSLKDIVIEAKDTIYDMFKMDEHIDELVDIIDRAISCAENDSSDIDNIHMLGEGWVAEETLAIAIYCALKYQDDFSKAIITSVNHKGDSDSTGAVTGNILGAWLGYDAIDENWLKNLELSEVIEEVALDLCHGCMMSELGTYKDDAWISKYIEKRRYK